MLLSGSAAIFAVRPMKPPLIGDAGCSVVGAHGVGDGLDGSDT